MRRFVLIPLLLAALSMHHPRAAAADEPTQSRSAEAELATAIENGTSKDVAALRDLFVKSPDFVDRFERMAELESDTIALLSREPLRLGGMGAALLDQFYGNLLGHQAFKLYYEDGRVNELEAAANHGRILELLTRHTADSGDGSRERPYAVFSAGEASAFLSARARQGVGSMYTLPDGHGGELGILILSATAGVEPGSEPLLAEHFDLTETYRAIRRRILQQNPDTDFGPEGVIFNLARQGDLAAMATIGTFGLTDPSRYDQARPWLERATRRGNLLAQLALAQLYTTKARSLGVEDAVPYVHMAIEQHLQAIAKGSTDAMVQLARIYLEEHFGINDTKKAIGLLEKAASLETIRAITLLSSYYYAGEHVEKDVEKAASLMHEAGALGDTGARMSYARILVELEKDRGTFAESALPWITQAGEDDDVNAMMFLGEVYAKGNQVRHSTRRAKRWFKRASDTSKDPQIINHVAWTLTVSDQTRLRDTSYALEIMERMMNQDPQARRNPAYIDTWAAAYAANGDFERAMELQQEALTQAEQAEADYVDILRDHLASFRKQELIEEAVP